MSTTGHLDLPVIDRATPAPVPAGCRALGEDDLPLVLGPAGVDSGPGLVSWLLHNSDWVQARLVEHGALLFRDFNITDAVGFEAVARAVEPRLGKEYLGTSPREPLQGSDYIFSASELPAHFPIAQHAEMTFVANPPGKLFFCCFEQPGEDSGETPVTDLRRVWRELDEDLKARLVDGGVRIVRNYCGPGVKSRSPFQLKGWDEMFGTTDRVAVEAKCREQGFDVTWLDDNGLRLVSTQAISRDHPETGEAAWHNHLQVFHLSSAAGEYRRIFRMRPTLRNFAVWQFARLLTALQGLTRSSEEQAMHCTRLDGSEIPTRDVEAVRDAIWRNMKVTPWRRGDVLVIDNHSTSHGRLPYSGPRKIAAAWS
ncbi:MAG: TauD/TfdA family dioxygenase [Deltaproteobacteria bacterium]|nr:TauD/TfdA family dioxygenase [Deltaproteobacteria bacterium]